MRHLSLEVVLELQSAVRAYEDQQLGRGARFLAQVEATARRIADAPLSFAREPTVRRPVLRRAKVHRIPYMIVYGVLRGEPIVIASVHDKRGTRHWRRRLQ